MHLIGIFTLAGTTWDYIKDRWSYINKTMWPCYAITISHLGPSPGLGEASECAAATPERWRVFLRNFCKIAFDGGNFTASLFRQRGGSILPQTHQDKEETGCVLFAGYCCLLPLSHRLNGNYCRLPIQRGARARWGCPDPAVSRGERQELSKLTPLPAPVGSAPPAAAPRGPRCTLLLISSISSLEGTGPKWMQAPFLTSAILCTFEVLRKC